jgi:hypothetical protein
VNDEQTSIWSGKPFKASNEKGNGLMLLHCRLIVKAILSIDKEGKTLYFASNMPGSLGGTDLWKVTVNADGTFGIPENLGNSINTGG